MRRLIGIAIVSVLVLFVTTVTSAQAQLSQTAAWVSHVSNEYRTIPNVTYHVASNYENKVDLYLPRNATGETPVLMYIHGGGWVGGNKEANVLRLLPYLEMGWAVVNVQYRLGRIARAPAAVEDCLCALQWVKRHADDYNFDVSKIVVTGNSAGGHLALTTGMVPKSSGLDLECQIQEPLGVAAIINWYGITDVGDLIQGHNTKSYAVRWMGSLSDRLDVARREALERQQLVEYEAIVIGQSRGIGGDAPGGFQILATKDAQSDVGVADVQRQEHDALGESNGRLVYETRCFASQNWGVSEPAFVDGQ